MMSEQARMPGGGSGMALPSGTKLGAWTFTRGEPNHSGLQTPRDRWDRPDGAAVIYSKDWYWANPANPRHRGWTAYAPDDEQPLTFRRRTSKRKHARRWKTAEAAMEAVDREFPLDDGRRKA